MFQGDETVLIAIILILMSVVPGIIPRLQNLLQNPKIEEKIEEAKKKAEQEPGKSKLTWDEASARLDGEFQRNHFQVQAIFWLSIVVMVIGFAIIIWGIGLVLQYDAEIEVATIATLAGVVTEFIGATFLYMYKSTLRETSQHFETLEYMNSIGMAMQIIDTLPEGNETPSLKEKTKAEIATALIVQSPQKMRANGED